MKFSHTGIADTATLQLLPFSHIPLSSALFVIVCRSSYEGLVHRGILKEWNEPEFKKFEDFLPQRPPLIWSNNVKNGKIEGWNVERGTADEIVAVRIVKQL